VGNIQRELRATRKGVTQVAYEPSHTHGAAPPPQEPGWTGYAAIKYTAIVIVVLAVIAFLVWALTNFIGD
jgi:hypothetical protein